MISRETATRIAQAHAEIEAAQKLLEDLRETASDKKTPDLRDGFGRGLRRGIELGVRNGAGGMRCYDVAPALALNVIEAHIAAKRTELADLCRQAIEETSW